MKSITIEQQEANLEKRKAELGLSGNSFVSANTGESRTESKRALLSELDKTKSKNGSKRAFKADF